MSVSIGVRMCYSAGILNLSLREAFTPRSVIHIGSKGTIESDIERLYRVRDTRTLDTYDDSPLNDRVSEWNSCSPRPWTDSFDLQEHTRCYRSVVESKPHSDVDFDSCLREQPIQLSQEVCQKRRRDAGRPRQGLHQPQYR